jgi:DNA-binding IscR family transcriptional regulator
MLQVIEAVDGPMISQFDLVEQAPRTGFTIRADKVYRKAIAQARAVFDKTTLSDLLGGR